MARKATNSTGEEATFSTSDKVIATTHSPAAALASAAAPAEGAARSTASAPRGRTTKPDLIRSMLVAPAGTSLSALCEATRWQSHSVRAALTGLRKAGCTIEKSKAEDGTMMYRITAEPEAAT